MIRARIPVPLLLAIGVAACGQKGDLRLPQGKTQAGQASAAPAQPAPSAAPTPPAQSTK
jgi:predicted small lipoprotein YifL